jgi:hypothetical protein
MGLRHLELNGMVIPLISIDEFEPKMGTTEEVIVISFFCRDELPAFDLDEFIDKSVVEFLDSEVSPNPNEDGLYLVFIELNFWLKFYDLVKDIENVTGKINWKVQPYLVDKLYDLKDPELHDVVITKEQAYVPRQEFDQTVESYFQDSDLLLFEADDTHIKLGGSGSQQIFEFVGFGTTDNMVKRLRLNEQHIDLMHTSMALGSLRGMLGGNWEVQTIGDYYFLNKVGNERSVVVRSQ